MALEFMDSISQYIPSISTPDSPLSLREKMYWTAGIIAVYFMLYNTYAVGVNRQAVAQPFLQLISIIFAAKIGSLITVGIGPIVLSSMVLQLIQGSGIIEIDLSNPAQEARFQSLQKLAAHRACVHRVAVFVATGYVPIASHPLMAWWCCSSCSARYSSCTLTSS